MASLDDTLRAGYEFDDDSVIFGRAMDPELDGTNNEHFVQVPLRQLNKHGLIAGATGTGKTKTLQLFAEQLSSQGVPVFLADLKGDLSGLAEASPGHPKIDERMAGMDLAWTATSHPIELLSLSGEVGLPLRVPVSSFGPLLLAKVIDASPTQESVLQVIYSWADEEGLALLDLEDLVALLKWLTTDEGKAAQKEIGGLSTATLNVLLRKCIELTTQGAEQFFGEPEFDVDDLVRTDAQGRGIISVMNLTDVQDKPRLFSTFMMWLLAEVYEHSPEVGDRDKPRMVFFFDEAHLLFDGASKALLDAIELTVRMIRSKGVGVFFVTQQPRDVPDDVLAQLGNRVQHALRAFTPQDQKALKATAQTFPITEHYDVREALTNLGIGEALITVLGPKGAPTPTVATRLMAPTSRMDPADDATIAAVRAASEIAEKYATELNRESAAELLAARMEQKATEDAVPELTMDVAAGLVEEITDADYQPRAADVPGPVRGFRFTTSGGKGRQVKFFDRHLQTMEAGRLMVEDDTVRFLSNESSLEITRSKVVTITAGPNLLQFHLSNRKTPLMFWVGSAQVQHGLLTQWLGVDELVALERLDLADPVARMPTPDETVKADVLAAKAAAKEAQRVAKERDRYLKGNQRSTRTRRSSRSRRTRSGSVVEDMGASVLSDALGLKKTSARRLLRGVLGTFRR